MPLEQPASNAAANAAPKADPRPVSRAFTPATISALEQVRLRARSLAASGFLGRRSSNARGRSLEFADYRPYAAGDDPRDLDWNAVARFDNLLIKLFHAEIALPLHVYVDGSASMHWGGGTSKFAAALRFAAGLGAIAAPDDTPVDIHVGGAHGGLNDALKIRRRAGLPQLLGQLDVVANESKPCGVDELSKALSLAVKRRASQTVVVITDGYEAESVLRPLGQLRSAGAEADLIQVLHPEELRPSLSGDFALEDLETGEQVRITVDEDARMAYRQRVKRFIGGWSASCRRRGIGYALIASDAEVGPALASALVKAGAAV